MADRRNDRSDDASAAVRGRRRLQLALAALWVVDALLQLQPPNFTQDLIAGTILGNAEGQPQPISGSIVSASNLLSGHAIALNVVIIVVQLAIGAGLAWRRSVRVALAVSVVWALGVWWLGEGFGGVFAGKATLLVGAPGPALLYALLALVAWPTARRGGRTIAAAGWLGERTTRTVWMLLWAGGALWRVVPFWYPPVYALHGDFRLSLDEEPRWIFGLNDALAHFAQSAGLALVIAIAVVEATIGIGVLALRHQRAFLAAGMLVAVVYWAVGQQFAELFTGSATDVAAGPLYVLLALTLWPLRATAPAVESPTAATRGSPQPTGA